MENVFTGDIFVLTRKWSPGFSSSGINPFRVSSIRPDVFLCFIASCFKVEAWWKDFTCIRSRVLGPDGKLLTAGCSAKTP